MGISQGDPCIKQSSGFDWAVKLRQPVSILVGAMCLVLLFALPPSWSNQGFLFLSAEVLALALIVVAVLGRIWCSLYISGFKEDKVVSQGPYSIIRNPLYVFSFLGALGLGLASRHVLILIVLACFFLLYYPLVVLAEEQILTQKFGSHYLVYAGNTPRFLPRRLTLEEPDRYLVSPRHVRQSIQEVVCFFVLYGIVHLVAAA